ncbi:hypothetical protein [Eikenella corrodens]|nr:hypothetical protein [Eikenella corrodens]
MESAKWQFRLPENSLPAFSGSLGGKCDDEFRGYLKVLSRFSGSLLAR